MLAQLGGGVWEPSGRGEEGEAGDEEEDTWRADIEQELQVQEGPGAKDPFHVSQLHINMDRGSLYRFVPTSRCSLWNTAGIYLTTTRFFAHLCL